MTELRLAHEPFSDLKPAGVEVSPTISFNFSHVRALIPTQVIAAFKPEDLQSIQVLRKTHLHDLLPAVVRAGFKATQRTSAPIAEEAESCNSNQQCVI